ncbi:MULTISPECIES: CCA tRNA nucleotidyltransferase [unclassified Halorubrum]|uniref:CCA tRNA nucleotidyltransferase n=1 Tax=unclassified Halorubrum TaxID=2642239 RepID=UPI0010F450E4|nr:MULTISPECIES: CCA tRNA nucleotidyltransferase [unclassified Halorubrum]TKX41038.1 CCA tRNA nucleotidyltransferase [Halorubrum sp. ARQ200]TKX48661.1 CCA tRNA nucleotidyltransferase [Halorubrum sp. ASP121]
MDELEAVLSRVRERVLPEPAERERLRETAATLTDRTREAIADLPVGADVVQVGSTARGTWVAGDRDIDLFVRFDADLDRAELEEYGLEVGHAVLPDGHEEYAEHPYVKGSYEGFDVDLVPCHDVESAGELVSAVDRTPFHDAYLSARLDDDLAADVVLAKAFLKGIGAYGSDLRTEGFSGYLTELLVLELGGFVPLVESARSWHPPVEFDPEGHAERTFEDPLVVVDPTDPTRNVAAVLSATNLARFQHYARELLAAPSGDLFEPDEPEPLDPSEVRAHLDRRGTTPVAVVFDAPDVVDDQLWPQLRRSLDGIVGGLNDRGFDVLRARAMTDAARATGDVGRHGAERTAGRDGSDGATRAALYAELEVTERPAVERHDGPPVAVRKHAASFYESYVDDVDPDTYGPFIDGDRYVVEREREFATVREYLESDAASDVALGAQVEPAFDDRDVLVGEAVATLAPAFGRPLREFYEPRP